MKTQIWKLLSFTLWVAAAASLEAGSQGKIKLDDTMVYLSKTSWFNVYSAKTKLLYLSQQTRPGAPRDKTSRYVLDECEPGKRVMCAGTDGALSWRMSALRKGNKVVVNYHGELSSSQGAVNKVVYDFQIMKNHPYMFTAELEDGDVYRDRCDRRPLREVDNVKEFKFETETTTVSLVAYQGKFVKFVPFTGRRFHKRRAGRLVMSPEGVGSGGKVSPGSEWNFEFAVIVQPAKRQ